MNVAAHGRRRTRSRRRSARTEDPRVAAVSVLLAVDNDQGSFRDQLPLALEALSPNDRPRCQAWCYGLARYHIALAERLGRLLDKPLKARDADLGWLLELGLYQLEHSEVPAPLVVSETVNAVEGLDNKSWARGLVNAVLRRALRERESGAESPLLDPALRHAMPSWIYQSLLNDWGARAETVAEASNQQGPMTVRVAGDDANVSTMLARFADAGIGATGGERARNALVLDHPIDVAELPGFAEGAVSVQDESAQLAIEILADAAPAGARLLDACAAPGGKTAHALDTGHFGDIVALDSDPARLARVSDTLKRLGRSDDVVTHRADAAQIDAWWDGQPFDAVLLDAPCTGSGVIRRHPDIKLLRRESDVQALTLIQATLLDRLWTVLAPGGHLLYATCSIFKSENEEQIAAFLHNHADAEACAIPAHAGLACPDQSNPVGRQFLPIDAAGGDGFWYALLRRAG